MEMISNLLFSPRGPVVTWGINLHTQSIHHLYSTHTFSDLPIIWLTLALNMQFFISSGQYTHFNKHNRCCSTQQFKIKINT